MTSKGTRSSSTIFHDTMKPWCCHWGEGHGYTVEMEDKSYKFRKDHPCIPDVVFRYGKDTTRHKTVIIEVQNGLTTEKKRNDYLEECKLKYGHMPFIIIDLVKHNKPTPAFNHLNDNTSDVIERAYKALSDQLDNETKAHIMSKVNDNDYLKNCELCNRPFKKKNLRPTKLGDICRVCFRLGRDRL